MSRLNGTPAHATLWLVAMTLLAGCTQPETPAPNATGMDNPAGAAPLRVVGTAPLEGRLLGDHLTLYFSEPVAWPDDPSTDRPFTVEPEVSGAVATGPTHMSFRPEGLQEDAILQLTLREDLAAESGAEFAASDRTFVFSPFEMKPLRVWMLEESDEQAVLGMAFPASVDADAVAERLTVTTDDGTELSATVTEGTARTIVRVALTGNDAWPVRLTVAAGLPDARGLITQPRDVSLVFPEDSVLRLDDATWSQFDEWTQEILLRFSSTVNSDTLRESLSLTDTATGDEVAYSTSTGYDSTEHRIYPEGVDIAAPVSLTLQLPVGFESVEKSVLIEPVERVLAHRPRPLTIESTWFQHEGREGLALAVYLSLPVDGGSLKDHVEFVPELPNMRIEPDSGGRFRVYGDWRSKRQYRMQLTPGLLSANGTPLNVDLSRSVTTDQVPAHVGFDQPGKYYFPRRNAGVLNLETRNVEKATVTMHRMFPSNVAVALSDMSNDTASYAFNQRWAEELDEAELTLATHPDRIVTTPVPLERLLPDGARGVFCVTARGDDGRLGSKLLLRTSIGLLAHWVDDSLSLFAHDLYTLAPLDGATVTVYSGKNQELGAAATNAQGLVAMSAFDTALGTPAVAVVEHGDDYTFLELERRDDPLPELPNGAPGYDREGYDAYLYADRNLYRPGETVHLRWLVRTNYGDAVDAMPLLLNVVKPNGRSLMEETVTLTEFGAGAFDLETQKAYPTGKYTAQIHMPGTKTILGSYEFSVEDFVPNRIKTEVTSGETLWVSGAPQTIRVNAQHLFGAPASDRKVEAEVVLSRGGFSPEGWDDYRFDNDAKATLETIALGEGRTDGEGNASFDVTYAVPEDVTFTLTGQIVGRVFELGGRAVTDSARVTIVPDKPLLGLSLASPESSDRGVDVHVAAVQPDAAPAALSMVTVTLEKQVWNYYVRRYYGHHEPNWAEEYEEVETREVALSDGRGMTHFDVNGYGYYRVRVHSNATPMASSASFYGYRGRFEAVTAPRPSLITVTTDRSEYTVGDTAHVRIESPFDGQGIVVVQGDEIQQIRSVAIVDGVGALDVAVGPESFPNVWLEATVVHAIDEEHAKVYPFSSYAMTPLKVNEPGRRLDVILSNVPEEIRPATTLAVDIGVRNASGVGVAAEVTVAAVDEGIHGITNYASPDPYAWVARLRRPDYRRAHYYDKVAYDFDKASASGGAEVAKRAAALGDNWIKPVALWSGVVETDSEGNATVRFEVPEFTGRLRIVAVAASKEALGASDGGVFVRRPVLMRTSMPRFLLTLDRAECRGALFNHHDEDVVAHVAWSAHGVLNATNGEQTLTIPAGGEVAFRAPISAGAGIGQGEMQWTATIQDATGATLETLTETAPIPVRPPAAYQTFHGTLVIEPGAARNVQLSRVMVSEQAELELTVGANPMLRLETALEHVVGYPYGCLEQTTSRLLPMYLLRQQQDLVDLTMDDAGNLEGFLSSGIDRLIAMQTGDGGMAAWPGGETPYPYGSVYALHFLTLVKRGRELPVPEANIAALQDYVRGLIEDPYGEGPSNYYLRAYAVYALALDGDLAALDQIGRFDRLEIPRTARYLLAAALAENTEDTDRVSMYLANYDGQPYTVREQGGTLNSDVRNSAVELLARLRIGGGGGETAALAAELIAFLEANPYGTTHETALVCAALSDYLDTIKGNVDLAKATIVGPDGEYTVSGSDIRNLRHEGPRGAFAIANTGEVPMYVTVTESGVPTQPDLQPANEGIAVTTSIFASDGTPHEGDAFDHTENYIVAIKLDCERSLQNVVLADVLPAGFEIVNPRLSVDAMPTGDFAEAETPAYLDIRDDRIVLAYDSLSQGPHYAYYIVSAVTAGEFQDPPAVAECMYDLQVRGRSNMRAITVAAR